MEAAIAKIELQVASTIHALQDMQAQVGVLKQNLVDLPAVSEVAAGPAEQTGARDFSKWLFRSTWHNKRNFPLAVFQHYVAGQLTLPILEKMFSVENVYPTPILGNKKVFKLAHAVADNEISRFHSDVVTTKDGKDILVTNQLGMNNFPQLIVYLAKCFGFTIKGKGLNPDLWPKSPRLPFIGPDVTYLDN
jgi:hypothetical protein